MIDRVHVAALAALGLLTAGLSACVPNETGFVEIRTFPSSSGAKLFLDNTKLDPIKGGGSVLKQKVGTRKLQTEMPSGNFAVLCEVVVKKNRITTVTVSTLERPPRCQCRQTDTSAERPARTCVG